MSETGIHSGTSLPPPPQTTAGAPGYDGHNSHSSQTTSQHMPPPPLPPVIIPQNTNPIPTAVTSPIGENGTIVSPNNNGVFARRAAPEPNKRALYVGGLDPRVTEDVLRQIFETTGHVQNVKIIPDKNVGAFQSKGFNYGFVEYDDPGSAERAMQTLNGRRVHQAEIRVNWAYQSNTSNKEDTTNHFHVFVGDLSNEVNDEVLLQAFSAFGSISEARVLWDMKTGRSRGYGFVSFRERQDAEKALSSMDGEWLGSRAIRCNWANQKGQPSIADQHALSAMGMAPTTPLGHHHFPTHGVQSYDMVVHQTPQWQTTVYVGNLTPYTNHSDVVPLFQNFGYVVESRFQADRGFAFVKLDTHENAAMAICQLSGYNVNGRPLKCSWGKDKAPPQAGFDNPQAYSSQAAAPGGYPATPSTFFPQYGALHQQTGPHSAGPLASGQSPGPFASQQGSYGGLPGQSQGHYGGHQLGYNGSISAGGYSRGQPAANPQWSGSPSFGTGFGGYQ
ncbi:Oligouridylate-binding protein 1 [Erysiphe neolycopersici]|uniref:Oligouridylate-binding protein 1 n=1 Tax=Erysiphe neolycopersici TaxID=212602 RepID=A0A420HTK4_9PEZI|nr:Oligouridylate-binding protein 1 [Erysiphe neolycopersici]